MFLVCGEALMDVFCGADTAAGVALDARVGGSPFNVALGLARLGQPVAFLGGVSTGALGERLMRALHAEGIDAGCVARVDAPTTLSVVGLGAGGQPSYHFHGEGAADRRLPDSAIEQLPEAVQAIHLGSYAMVVPPVAELQRRLVAREHGRRLIAYDPNVRLNVEPDLQRWRVTLEWMTARAHLLKVSAEDLALLHPGDSAATCVARWLRAGVRLVVVTDGADGAEAWTAQAHAQAPAHPVAVADTVGAGDSFQAALLCWLAEQDRLSADALAALDASALRAALGFAMQAAALTCTRRGADLPRRDALAASGGASAAAGAAAL